MATLTEHGSPATWPVAVADRAAATLAPGSRRSVSRPIAGVSPRVPASARAGRRGTLLGGQRELEVVAVGAVDVQVAPAQPLVAEARASRPPARLAAFSGRMFDLDPVQPDRAEAVVERPAPARSGSRRARRTRPSTQ